MDEDGDAEGDDEAAVAAAADISDAAADEAAGAAAGKEKPTGVGGDIDMTDIMVIDEYDSTKERAKPSADAAAAATSTASATATAAATITTPAAAAATVASTPAAPKPLDERDRRDLEKRYKLPEHPHLIVHPSRTAKAGKFSCNVMSLSILLDYRPEDSKEHSFEVSLFAELFNEMLMRDFGFNIYKALSAIPEPRPESEAKSKATGEKSPAAAAVGPVKKEELVAGAEPVKDAVKEEAAKEEPTAAAKEKEKEAPAAVDEEPKEKRARRSDDEDVADKTDGAAVKPKRRDDDELSLKSDSTRRRAAAAVEKTVARTTVDPELLLSFVYFDQTHCGYILEKDVEELFYTLGLHLSRAQTRRLLAKVVHKDAVHYRRLTDRSRDEEEQRAAANATEQPEALNVEQLARGNRAHLPVFVPMHEAVAAQQDADSEETALDAVPLVSATSAMVAYKGGFVDIEKLLEQMRRSEKARTDTEQLLVDLRRQNAELTSGAVRSKEKIRDLQSDVKSYSRKLGDAEQSLSGTQVSDFDLGVWY